MILITRLIAYNNYNSFSGCDVVVTAQMALINNGERDYSPKVHVLGSLQTMSYSTHQDKSPVRSIGNINAKDYVQGQRTVAGTMVFAMFHQHWMIPLLEELKNYVSNTDIWSDELPALNLTLSMANEYGYKSNMAIYGVQFIDDGGVMSINDLFTENTLQYVATGIQPLKSSGQYEHTYSIKSHHLTIADYKPKERSLIEMNLYNKEWKRDKYDFTLNDYTIVPSRYAFSLDSYVNEPLTRYDDYVVNIFNSNLDPNNDIINLYLLDNKTGNRYDAVGNSNNGWAVKVPEGEYTVEATDLFNNTINDLSYIKASPSSVSGSTDDYPIVCEVGSVNAKFISNDSNHDCISLERLIQDEDNDFEYVGTGEVFIYDISTHTSIGRSNSKEILIENLEPDTNYVAYTFNSETLEKSGNAIFKTFVNQKQANSILNEYILNNSDILVTDLMNYNLDSAEYEYNNLIDSLMILEDSNEKTELLFYAAKLQNEFNKAFNDLGISFAVTNNKEKPLISSFEINEDVASIVIYRVDNDKNYYVTKSNPTNDFQYNGKTNTRYFVQPVLQNNKKSSRTDFVCFDKDQTDLLKKYNNVNNISNVTFLGNDPRYNILDNDLKTAIKAANNLDIYKKLLPAPYGEVHNNILVADVDYSEYNINDSYLCIATPNDALDYTPIRKIKLNGESKTLILDYYRTGIIKDNYYLLWIQDKDFNNISPAYILSSFKNNSDVNKYYNILCSDYIKSLKNKLSNVTSYKTYMDNLIINLLAEDEIKYKDLDYYIMQTFLSLYSDTFTSYVMDEILSDVVYACSLNCKLKEKAVKDKNSIYFPNMKTSMIISSVNITLDNIIKKTHNVYYDMDVYEEGYTLVFVIDSLNSYRSGYVLINNKTKEVYASNIELEMINNG